MARAFKRLESVLKLESQQGFQNKAVVGGIRQFVTYWVGQAREEAVDEADRALVEQVADVLSDYSRLPGIEARASAIDNLLEQLEQRRQRLRGQPAPAPAADRPARQPQAKTRAPAREAPKTAPQRPPAAKEPGDKTALATQAADEAGDQPVAPSPAPEVEPDPEGLRQPVTALKGVGPKLAELLGGLAIATIWDLLNTFPRRYDDYTLMKPINRLQYGETVTVIGTVWETRARRTRTNQTMVQSIVNDGTGSIQVTWFNQRWLADKIKPNMQIVLSGTVDQFLGRPVMNNPEWEPLAWEPLRTRRIVPVYPLTQGLNGYKMRQCVQTAVEQWSGRIPDPLPERIRQQRNLYSRPQAYQQIHFPDNQASLHQARQRLVFDELFLLQLGMLGQRHEWRSQTGKPVTIDPELLTAFAETLPFDLTAAQQRVIQEIAGDLAHDVPMNRLLQGDVGAGKTVVAAAAMLFTVRAGRQAALMAPTEILAEQHYQGLSRMLAPFDVNVALLTGSTTGSDRDAVYTGLADGSVHVLIGTHAIIQEPVQFHDLALAVIDEQHRFGVDQRGALRDKGRSGVHPATPHLLVMSATPIPRTLALSMYGDLDLSLLDEMPPGRQEIKTRWLHPRERERAYVFLRRQVEEGRQGFIIYPLVEESDKIDAKAAVAEHAILQDEVFPNLKVGLLHGRMKPAEKEAVMRDFYEGKTDVLVSTSVIEVGVDVPNSTVMIIEGANRFGLAQLHQFRGRVGRGEHQSYCLLIAEASANGDTDERLRALEQSNDGFVLAEKDLEIRGPGEFFGRRQSGLPELRLASLLDMEGLNAAREEALALFEADPLLEQPGHAGLREQVAAFWEQAGDLS